MSKVKVGGSVSESNRSAALRPLNGFEDHAHHRMKNASRYSVSTASRRIRHSALLACIHLAYENPVNLHTSHLPEFGRLRGCARPGAKLTGSHFLPARGTIPRALERHASRGETASSTAALPRARFPAHTPGSARAGTYSLVLNHPGNGPPPLSSVSQRAGTDNVFFDLSAGNLGFSLTPNSGGSPVTFATLAFSALYDPATSTCTGVSVCGVGTVGSAWEAQSRDRCMEPSTPLRWSPRRAAF
ncbi:MAG: hypothetical protein JWP63_2303 [Candidatus Solibacter sp.]|nr:hypothetical protein [Candidatus Solibacter sp.]